MRYTAFVAVSAVALALSGCGKKSEPDPQGPTGAETAGMAGDVVPPVAASAGQIFADTAASSDAFEIATSQLAAEQAGSAKTKNFATNMVKAHTDSTAKLKAAASAATPAITPTVQLNSTQQQVLDGLKAKTGADFDRAYAAAQVDAHQQTLDVLKGYSASGDVVSLKDFATAMVPVVTAHLNMAKGL
jgi:putative membrane protein